MRESLDLLIDKISEIHIDIVKKIMDVVNIQAEYSKRDEENKAFGDVVKLLDKTSQKLNVEKAKLIILQSQLKSLAQETKCSENS